MKNVGLWFLVTAVICVTLGMVWGIEMSIRADHLMSPAHAHLNLVGWVTMALFGFYYCLTPQAGAAMLAKVHYLVALAGIVTMAPGIALAILEKGEMLAIIGSLLTLASMLIFLATVLMHGLGQKSGAAI